VPTYRIVAPDERDRAVTLINLVARFDTGEFTGEVAVDTGEDQTVLVPYDCILKSMLFDVGRKVGKIIVGHSRKRGSERMHGV
jgi:hypothetical protein